MSTPTQAAARLISITVLLSLGAAFPAAAQSSEPTIAVKEKIAVLRLEALGMDPEPVARLESLFRMEIERLVGHPLPTRRQIDATIRKSRKLRRCGSDNRCVAAIGAKLGVDLVVTGSVAALGDSYIINIKVVDVKTGQLRGEPIASEPLRGRPDQLIEAVRTAAYTMLAPDQVRGSIMVLSDLVGAAITLDGKRVGITPLRRPIRDLRPGRYQLAVSAHGYLPFEKEVVVRFQKTTRVVVKLAPVAPTASATAPPIVKPRPASRPFYTSTWFYVGSGVVAAIVGGYLGYRLAHDPVLDCNADPSQCAR